MDGVCYRGAKAICRAVGENPKEIVRLVRDKGLPAWKRENRGMWRALPEDLKQWMRGQRDVNLAERAGG
ncbi:MAG: DNA-binding protein [Desulfovibrionaceae bacterium]|nr:DNA-binding protein [Desulfovibrionaceae bacterium]MDD4951073.1 DNA-binding protein [Desulfovibrionaceae bacterium]